MEDEMQEMYESGVDLFVLRSFGLFCFLGVWGVLVGCVVVLV